MNVGVEVEIKITDSPVRPALPYGTSVYRYDTPCCTVSETCNFEKALLRWGDLGVIAAGLQRECGTAQDMLPVLTGSLLCISDLKK